MKKFLKMFLCLCVSVSILGINNLAQAKRFGSGKNAGRQNTTAIQRANDPANAPKPTQPNNQQQPVQPTQPTPQKSRFGGMAGILGGLAAGIGLAWLASKLGLGAGFGNILLIIGVIMLGFLLYRMFKQRQMQAHSPMSKNIGDKSYSNAKANESNNSYSSANNQFNQNPEAFNNTNANYNNFPTNNYSDNGQNSAQTTTFTSYPTEINQLLQQANTWFTDIQYLSDNKDYAALEQKLSPELFIVIKQDLQASPMLSKTLVQNLNNTLLDWRETQFEFLATIQYKAQVSEDDAPYTPINEAWTFTKDKTTGISSPWKLDGISQLNQ